MATKISRVFGRPFFCRDGWCITGLCQPNSAFFCVRTFSAELVSAYLDFVHQNQPFVLCALFCRDGRYITGPWQPKSHLFVGPFLPRWSVRSWTLATKISLFCWWALFCRDGRRLTGHYQSGAFAEIVGTYLGGGRGGKNDENKNWAALLACNRVYVKAVCWAVCWSTGLFVGIWSALGLYSTGLFLVSGLLVCLG